MYFVFYAGSTRLLQNKFPFWGVAEWLKAYQNYNIKMRTAFSCSFAKKCAFPDISLCLVITWELSGGLFWCIYTSTEGERWKQCADKQLHIQSRIPYILHITTHTYLSYRPIPCKKTWKQICVFVTKANVPAGSAVTYHDKLGHVCNLFHCLGTSNLNHNILGLLSVLSLTALLYCTNERALQRWWCQQIML